MHTWLLLGASAASASALLLLVWPRDKERARSWLRRAFSHREAARRTEVSSFDVRGWVNALQLKDPDFDLDNLYAKARQVFELLQRGCSTRDLAGVRPFLSDATYQRFRIRLELMRKQGLRHAICGWQMLDVQLIGLDQSHWFDTVHLRIRAQVRGTEVPVDVPDAEATAAAEADEAEPFIEVWSFVRKPGAKTRAGQDLFQGRCPNCGAPFHGGATNTCTFCKAIVNSGNYDWTLATITQGSEHIPGYPVVEGLLQARESDPALNLEILEDRVTLLFWRWIEAQASGDTLALTQVSAQHFLDAVEVHLGGPKAQRGRDVIIDCAVDAAITRLFREEDGYEQAHVEIRWTARSGAVPEGVRSPALATLPQRWMLVVIRKTGAQTRTESGLATTRCGHCGAPLTEASASACSFCGSVFTAGLHDWVLSSAQPYEVWNASEAHRFEDIEFRQATYRGADTIIDPTERKRLLQLMAAVAAADGELDPNERKLLAHCADRWLVPWQSVEAALASGLEIYNGLLPRAGSREATVFVESLVNVALLDGRIDAHESRLLALAAEHLGMSEQLPELLVRLRRR